MIRVTIVDDHQLFAEGLAEALNSLPDIRVVGVVGDGSQLRASLEGQPCDVLLMDLEMPTQGGIETLSRLKPEVPTLIVSMHTDLEHRSQAFRVGAVGFLSKSAPVSDVAAAIRGAAAGEVFRWETDEERLIQLDRFRAPTLDPGAASLTDREVEILTLLGQGISSTEELSERLFISPKTVKNHLASIFAKLAVADRTQAAVEAIRLGLVKPR